MLKTSARNSSVMVSVSFMSLITAESRLANPGPLRMFRPALPNVPGGDRAKAEGLNQQVTVPTGEPFGHDPVYGLPIRSGRWLLSIDCTSALSNPRTGVNGTLLWKLPIPEICHPPIIFPANPVA